MALSKEKALELLQSMEGYHQRLKELHWAADRHARHILTDEIDDGVLDFEDELAEAVMGKLGEKFGSGDLKTMLPNAKELSGMLDEMEEDVNKFIDSIGNEHGYGGIYNVTDDFLTKIYKWKYLETLS